ncbi:hypothetical protein HispidOSU_006538 [Sigmodon hispidus]
MEPCRSLALFAGSLGLISSLIALSTDFWIVAIGPTSSSHSGLWPRTHEIQVAGYIHVTQSFCILAALWSLVSVGFLILSYIRSLSAPGRGPLVSTVMAFAAGNYSAQLPGGPCWGVGQDRAGHSRTESPLPRVSTPGCLSLGAHCRSHRAGYETL